MTIGTTTPTRNTAGTVARIVLTLIGSAMMVIGAFMHWVRGLIGTNLTWKSFYSMDLGHAQSFVESIGFIDRGKKHAAAAMRSFWTITAPSCSGALGRKTVASRS